MEEKANQQKAYLITPILWLITTIIWIVILVMNINNGLTNDFLIILQACAAVASLAAAIANFVRYIRYIRYKGEQD